MGVPGSGVIAALSLRKLAFPMSYGDFGGLAFPELLGGEHRGAWPAARVGAKNWAHLSLLDTIWSSGSLSTPFPEASDATGCYSGQVGKLVAGLYGVFPKGKGYSLFPRRGF